MRGVHSHRGKVKPVRTVQGVFFSTSNREEGRFEYMRDKVKDVAMQEPSEWWIDEGYAWAEKATRYETHGLGLWRIGILVNDKPELGFWEWVKGKFRLG